ncbi:GAP family protein [Streptomyces sp. NPDC090442]|uniref:GAP family protein n=1 Tax=Streptomyces sp. NPDC090442 TaxID=3365962 RepID=UPI003805C07A
MIGEVAPPALGIALSPFPVIPAILLLFTRRPRATSNVFLTGWTIGIAVPTGVFTTLASVIEQHEETPTWASWARIVLGTILLAVGIQRWFSSRQQKTAPQWMRSLEESTPAPALRLGLLLSAANPKILLLAMAGGLSIGAADLPAPRTVTAVVVFTAIAACTVALPVLLHALLGERIVAPLRRAKGWLEVHNATVMTLVITAIGIVLIAEGCTTLWNQR